MINELKSLRYAAPDDLRKQLTDLGEKSEKRSLVIQLNFGNWLGAALGAAALLAFFVFANAGGKTGSDELLVQEVTSSHVRSLMDEHLFDVASTDQHTVKPWFGGRLDFAPQVVDLKDAGFPLVGGRLDYIAARPVAALVYRREKHVINLFTWPEARGKAEDFHFASSQGFNVWRWASNGMNFQAVSDLNANELKEFSLQYKSALPASSNSGN